MTEQRVRIDPDLGIDAHQAAVFEHRQRVDLKERKVVFNKSLVSARHQLGELADLLASQTQRKRHIACLEGLQSYQRIDCDLEDFLGRVVRDFFDFHAALSRGHESHATAGTIDHGAEVKLARNRINIVHQQHAVNRLTERIGLVGHQILAKQVFGQRRRFIGTLDHLHAARLAATTGMDLGFEHGRGLTELDKGSCRLFRRSGQHTLVDRQTIVGQQFLGLIFVEVHRFSL